MELSERLIKARKNRGFTQQDVSEAVQVEKETIMAWEAGTATPDVDKLAKLCEALQVSSDSLLFEKPPVPPTTPPTGLTFGDIFWGAVLADIAVIFAVFIIVFQ